MTITTAAIRTAAAGLTDLPPLDDATLRITAGILTDRFGPCDLEAVQTEIACALHCKGLDLLDLAEQIQTMRPEDVLTMLDGLR